MLALDERIYETEVPCNLCGSRDHRKMARHAEESVAVLQDKWKCTPVECRSCGLRFYEPRLSEDYAVKTFLHGNDAQSEAENMATKGVFFGEPAGSAEAQIAVLRKVYTELFENMVSKYRAINSEYPKALFELGTSVGWFAQAAIAYSSQWGGIRYGGVDANVFCARMAREKFRLNVQGTTFSKYEISATELGFYDLVAGFDFLEHTYTPRSDLEKLRTMTKKNGVLVIKTFVDDNDPKGTYVHPVFHHHHFTLVTLRDVIERAGWKVIEFDSHTDWDYSQVTVTATNPAT